MEKQESLRKSPSKNCVFCKILSKEFSGHFVYEGPEVAAFLDIHPANKGHLLIIPRTHYEFVEEIPESILSQMTQLAQSLLKAMKPPGANLLLSNGVLAGQEVPHAHLHLIPRFEEDGQPRGFFPRTLRMKDEELAAVAQTLRCDYLSLSPRA